jgi:hypothetical protein
MRDAASTCEFDKSIGQRDRLTVRLDDGRVVGFDVKG